MWFELIDSEGGGLYSLALKGSSLFCSSISLSWISLFSMWKRFLKKMNSNSITFPIRLDNQPQNKILALTRGEKAAFINKLYYVSRLDLHTLYSPYLPSTNLVYSYTTTTFKQKGTGLHARGPS